MDDMYCGEFEGSFGNQITFDIQDVGGNYVYNFPSMRTVSINSADAFLLVFSLDDPGSFEEAYKLKEMITDAKVNTKNLPQTRNATHHLGMNYYVNFLGSLGSNEFQLK